VHIIGPGFNSNIPLESNGAVPVNIQDQTSKSFYLPFIKAAAAPTYLSIDAAKGARALTLVSTTGFTAGCVIVMMKTNEFFIARQLGAPAGNVVTIDTPVEEEFSVAGSYIVPFSYNMNVNGSATPQIFQIGPVGAPSDIRLDVTMVVGHITDQTAMDDSLFGGISALTRGCVLRKSNMNYETFWNCKSNSELKLICANEFSYSAKAPSGYYGATFVQRYAGPENKGVTIRLAATETIELIVQDDLTGLDSFIMLAHGHYVTN